MRWKAIGAAFAALLGLSCQDKGDRFAPIVVDIAANCAAAEIRVLLADMDEGARPWKRVISAAVDAAGIDRYWALVQVELPDDPLTARIALLHVDGPEIDIQYIVEGLAPASGTTLELRPGPTPGSVWLVQTGSAIFRLWHLDATRGGADPVVAVSEELGGFPSNAAFLCQEDPFDPPRECDTSDWPRDLVFMSGLPFIVAVPPQSPNGTTYIYVGVLEPYLAVSKHQQLEFFRKCDASDPIEEYTRCTDENAATTYPSLTLMGSQRASAASEHRMFVLRQRNIDGLDEPSLEIVFVRLELDNDGNPAGILQSKVLKDVDPLIGTPSGLARDDFATYMLHAVKSEDGASGGVGPPVITRLSESDDEFDVLQGIVIPDDVDLLQLEADVAFGRVVEGAWEVTKLFPDAPERSETLLYEGSAPITRIESAGHGAYLLFKDDNGPDLVHLRCADTDDIDAGTSTGSTTGRE